MCDPSWPKCAFDFTSDPEHLKPADEFIFRSVEWQQNDNRMIEDYFYCNELHC